MADYDVEIATPKGVRTYEFRGVNTAYDAQFGGIAKAEQEYGKPSEVVKMWRVGVGGRVQIGGR